MLYGLYVSAAGALASSYRQDVVANNLANAQTVGFKRDLALMQARRTQADDNGSQRDSAELLEGLGGGLFALPTHTDFAPAPLQGDLPPIGCGSGRHGLLPGPPRQCRVAHA